MLLLGKTQKKHLGTSHLRYQTCHLHPKVVSRTHRGTFVCQVWLS